MLTGPQNVFVPRSYFDGVQRRAHPGLGHRQSDGSVEVLQGAGCGGGRTLGQGGVGGEGSCPEAHLHGGAERVSWSFAARA